MPATVEELLPLPPRPAAACSIHATCTVHRARRAPCTGTHRLAARVRACSFRYLPSSRLLPLPSICWPMHTHRLAETMRANASKMDDAAGLVGRLVYSRTLDALKPLWGRFSSQQEEEPERS